MVIEVAESLKCQKFEKMPLNASHLPFHKPKPSFLTILYLIIKLKELVD